MIPFIEQPSVSIGPLTLHAFGAIVAASVLVGLELGRRRFRRLQLNAGIGETLAWWTLAGGFLGAHLFSLLFYFPGEINRDPLKLLKIWEDISSFGGIVGGLGAAWLYLYCYAPGLSAGERRRYVDALAFVFAIALTIGRIACSVAHDHPGTITTFPLAISLESDAARAYILDVYQSARRAADLPPPSLIPRLGFHDLGWYEFLYLFFVIVPAMLVVDRKPRHPGTFFVLFMLLYLPVRFGLDFLRVADARYAGLTPAQWAAVPLLATAVVTWRLRTVR